MKLNPGKCKEMRVSFLSYDSCEWQPIVVGGTCIEAVQSFKLLGVYITAHLSWSFHCDYVKRKASRRGYALRKLNACGVLEGDIVQVYCCLVRPIMEYAASGVFSHLP